MISQPPPSTQNAYISVAADISALVSQLQTMADKLHDVSPDSINWGHVGDLRAIRAALLQLVQTSTGGEKCFTR